MKMYGVVCTSSVIHNYYISLLDLFLYCLLLPYQFTEHFHILLYTNIMVVCSLMTV